MINTRLSVAIHILSLISRDYTLSSEKIASSVNTNPVVIRRISSELKKAGLINAKSGVSGSTLTKEPSEITLFDIYQAVHINEDLFRIHENPNPNCAVGKQIQSALNHTFDSLQLKMEQELKGVTLKDVINQFKD